MAIGAVTEINSSGGKREATFFVEFTMVGDGAYPAGGSTGVEAALVTATGLDGIQILGVLNQAINGGYIAVWDRAADKLLLLEGNGVAPLVTNTTADVSATTFHLLAICR